jgi:hypothetical protein
VAKNAYTFAKRAKELAKKKKKEEKQQRKTQRDDVGPAGEGVPVYDEATGQVIMPEPAPEAPPE